MAKRTCPVSLDAMKSFVYIPPSLAADQKHLDFALERGATKLTNREFVRAWSSLSFLHPGLHPDSFGSCGSGWPNRFRPVVAEAWRRAERGELGDEQLYPSDATFAGLSARMSGRPLAG
jgi:hypothetical protein